MCCGGVGLESQNHSPLPGALQEKKSASRIVGERLIGAIMGQFGKLFIGN